MSIITRSKVIKIGNSRGVRIPSTLLEQVGLEDEIELIVQDNQLVIRPAHSPRQDWEAHFASMAQHGDDQLLDELLPTDWEQDEWEW